jgi:hypothetical protein
VYLWPAVYFLDSWMASSRLHQTVMQKCIGSNNDHTRALRILSMSSRQVIHQILKVKLLTRELAYKLLYPPHDETRQLVHDRLHLPYTRIPLRVIAPVQHDWNSSVRTQAQLRYEWELSKDLKAHFLCRILY